MTHDVANTNKLLFVQICNTKIPGKNESDKHWKELKVFKLFKKI